VLSRGKYVSPTLAEQLAKHLDAGGQRLPRLLSDREFEVMRRLGSASPFSDPGELAISAKTVTPTVPGFSRRCGHHQCRPRPLRRKVGLIA